MTLWVNRRPVSQLYATSANLCVLCASVLKSPTSIPKGNMLQSSIKNPKVEFASSEVNFIILNRLDVC